MSKTILMLNLSFVFSFTSTGYIEMNLDAFKNNDAYFFGYNKLRIDSEREISNAFLINFSVICLNNFGKKVFYSSDYLPRIDDDLNEIPPIAINDRIYFDQLYFSYKKNNFKILVGKQPVYYGSGYVWNPVNNISDKNSIDPSYEIEGINTIRMHYFSSKRDYDFILVPNYDGSYASMFSSMGFTSLSQSIRIYMSHFSKNVIMEDKLTDSLQNTIGISQAGALYGIGLWSEFNSYINNNRNDWLFGFDYTFNNGVYMMYERYHQDIYEKFENGYSSDIIMNYLNGNIRSIGSDYSFFSLGIFMDEFTRISLQSILNHTDGSSILFPQIDYSIMDDVDLLLMLYIFNGDRKTEFGIHDWGIKSRMQIYF